MSHVCGCSIAAPQVLQGWWQVQIVLSRGRAVIANCSRGVSTQLQHTGSSPPTATAHQHWNDQDREKGKARSVQCRERGVPEVPMSLPKGQGTPWSHGSCDTWISSSKRAPQRYGSPELTPLACAVPALAILSSSPLALLTQPILATRRSTCNDLGVVRTIWPMEHKQRKRKGPNLREKPVPEGQCLGPQRSLSTVLLHCWDSSAESPGTDSSRVQDQEPRHLVQRCC